jgi:hypothetical protein
MCDQVRPWVSCTWQLQGLLSRIVTGDGAEVCAED